MPDPSETRSLTFVNLSRITTLISWPLLRLGSVMGRRINIILMKSQTPYSLIRSYRSPASGGVAVILNSQFQCKKNALMTFKSFEYLDITVTIKSLALRVVVIYRPPPSKAFKCTFNEFLQKLSTLLEVLTLAPGSLLISGDFNVHIDSQNEESKKLCAFLDLADLCQYIYQPTHIKGHALDLVITRKSDQLLDGSIDITPSLPSDHFVIATKLHLPKPPSIKKELVFRKTRAIDITSFCHDIRNSTLISSPALSADSLANQYNSVLSGLLDKHAPLCSRIVTVRPRTPWFNDSISDAKKLKRRYERQWKKSKLEVHRQMFKTQCDHVHHLIDQAKVDYNRGLIADSNQKNLFQVVNDLLFKPKTPTLPTRGSDSELADEFATYFSSKVAKIRAGLDLNADPDPPLEAGRQGDFSLAAFHPASQDEIKKLVLKSPSKSCSLDPIPTWLLKACLGELLPTLTAIVNKSMSEGIFPSVLKKAVVTPLLKKPSLDQEEMKNYRPVSNLSYVSKLIERVVLVRLQEYTNGNNLIEKLQSAYRSNHSPETALLRVYNDLLMAVDSGREAVLTLLDLSAAFDTIDHSLLLRRLEGRFGLSSTVLSWFASYLADRSQAISVQHQVSSPVSLTYGVPQGSVLGPVLFVMYTQPLGDVIHSHGVQYHLFADDVQLYVNLSPPGNDGTLSNLEACVDDISKWMYANKLKLNNSKTEVIDICASWRTATIPSLRIVSDQITPSSTARNLGVIFASDLKLDQHVSQLCRASTNSIRKIGRIRKYLDKQSAEKLVHAFISSCLDFCNSLLGASTNTLLLNLQRIQNTAARIVTKSRKFDHITPTLMDLHWLPIKSRIDFKILLLCYKSIHRSSPDYLYDLLVPYVPSRSLRSSSDLKLKCPKYKLESYGRRAFSINAPILWNRLPASIKSKPSVDSFKSALKSHLFQAAFPS